jgi:hypothetical protein
VRLEGCISGKTGTYGKTACRRPQCSVPYAKVPVLHEMFGYLGYQTYESIGGRCLFNVVDDKVKIGLTGRGISV